MNEFREPRREEIPGLKVLWNQAFGDEGPFLDCFFSHAFHPARCRVAWDGEIRAMLYWFDCALGKQRLAYLYAVATVPPYQGQGLATRLLEDTHRHLEELGYAGTVLVPGSEGLFRFYERLGYRTAGFLCESRVQAGPPISLREIGPGEFSSLRRQFLPPGGVIQEGENLEFLSRLARFYAGADFLAVISREPDGTCLELLGNPGAAPGILGNLKIPEALVRIPGREKPFAMTHWLDEGPHPCPVYFGLAFD